MVPPVLISRDQLSSLSVGTAGGSSFTITFPTLPTPGASAFAAIGLNLAGTITSVKDNGVTQSTFTLDVTETGTTNHISVIYRADGISLPSSGSYALTVALSTTGASYSAGAATYLGKAAGGPLHTGVSTGTSTTVNTGSLTPNLSGSLFLATFQDNSSGTADNPTNNNANFTQRLSEGNGSLGQVYGFCDGITAGVSAQAANWTVGTSATFSVVLAVYSPNFGAPEVTSQAAKRAAYY
jgi:hypothetical protein